MIKMTPSEKNEIKRQLIFSMKRGGSPLFLKLYRSVGSIFLPKEEKNK